jgi:leader peptidase (prepilin peptidase)/N-methyltransferase
VTAIDAMLTLADLPPQYVRVLALLFGLVWGSFLNVVVHRLPRGMSVVRPASHCPHCETPIPAHHNLPVVSWILLGGRAACCRKRISVRYPLIELAGGVLSLAIVDAVVLALPHGTPAWHALALYLADLALALGLVAATFIDLEHMIVPDPITFGGTMLGLATFSVRGVELGDAVAGAALGFVVVWLPFCVVYAWLRGGPGMGLGDAKLLMLAGAWFGWSGALLVLGAAAVQGTLVAVALLLSGRGLPEPEAVQREREQLRAELHTLSPEERAELEAEMARDPLAHEPEPGWGRARVAFGPFLALASLELLLFGRERVLGWLLW